MSQALVLVGLLFCAATVSALSGGAPDMACPGLSPNPDRHGAQPQTDPNPYVLGNFQQAFTNDDGEMGYKPGQSYNFSVMRYDNNDTIPLFRGVLVQGRTMVGDEPTGRFDTSVDSNTQTACANDDGVTHTNANDKERVMLRWIAPAAGTGPVQIGWAVVQERIVYWADERSPMLAELPASGYGVAGSVMLVMSAAIACLASML